MYMLGTCKQQGQQQQEQPSQASELGMFYRSAERFAVLEYIMMQQQQPLLSDLVVSSTRSTVSNSSQGLESSSDGGERSSYVPPVMFVLQARKHLFERLLEERYPDFRQWYKQRQQTAKRQGQQPE
jgi:hypothetical protein